jgi:hypothetical protein
MCRSIKTLRPPFTDHVTPHDIEAAALQYVRKVAGMREPAAHNRDAFEAAVQAVAEATGTLLRDVKVRTVARPPVRQ